MSPEGQGVDKKSLRKVLGRTADWDAIAVDCVAFANARGGRLLIGIESDAGTPPPDQRIDPALLDIIRRKVGERTVNVTVLPEIRRTDNGGEFIDLAILRSPGVASTTDGRYYLRVSDECKPVVGDEVMRLAAERSALPWETQTTQGVLRRQSDTRKLVAFVAAIRASDRVKDSVKEKSDQELLDHYLLAEGELLTNLGVLCVGRREDRARLGTAPIIQFIKYDESGQKVNKLVWDDFSLTPMELVEAVWNDVPDFRESYELPDGLYRQNIPVYDESVVRELLVNALVHRPYTQRGDIFLNLHPDRLEVVNPGLLPLGVTPRNILHVTVRRNELMARVFHDLKLMEREGSGFDKVYEVLLSQGRPAPELREGPDRVEVIIRRRILKPRVIDFLAKADQTYQLSQRERITLGLLAQHEALTAQELAGMLELPSVDALQSWLGRLQGLYLVGTSGRTRATRYFIDPEILRSLDFTLRTSLKRIEPHRLEALILEDVKRYPQSKRGEIRKRIGAEITESRLKRSLAFLVQSGKLVKEGERAGSRYRLPD
jgi:ATP-dependent DNA helicase RecG